MGTKLEYNATLTKRLDLSSHLACFELTLDQPIANDPAFVAGQYTTIGLNNEAKPELGSVRRPMSIASAPQRSDALEFYIRLVAHPESDNPLTPLLWRLRVGDRLFCRNGATGRFTVDDTIGPDDDRLKVFVAAGTGLAPFLSMLRGDANANARSLAQYVVLHGASYAAELGYADELTTYQRDLGLHYLPTISRPREVPDWTGSTGRVEDFFLPDRLTQLEERLGLPTGGLTPDRAVVMVCGLQGTIQYSIERLLGRGFIPDHRRIRRSLEVSETTPASLFFEQYDNTPVVDLRDPANVSRLRQLLPAHA
ncbi:MAG: ferredoxin--NADP reductase [Myxococcales bacterium FL481]|nr:MAG: ferredoxin--NADP reductase [Myxococcales bacterium FL481]